MKCSWLKCLYGISLRLASELCIDPAASNSAMESEAVGGPAASNADAYIAKMLYCFIS